MNQKDWVEYFEAVNGRKPSMQEFQEAREKGEFVVERKEASTPTTEAPASVAESQAPAQEVPVASSAPFSQESTAFVPPQPSAETLQPVPGQKRPKLSFNKPTKFGLAVVAIVTAITLVWIFFFTGGPSLDGVWIRNTDSNPITYELSGKKHRIDGDETIKKVLKGNEAKKEFNKALSLINSSKLHTLADVDKKFNLKTTEVVVLKYDDHVLYNLLQKDGSNIILRDGLYDLKTYQSNSKTFKEYLVYHKVETPKVLVGKWEVVTEDSSATKTILISDHGIISSGGSTSQAAGFYSMVDEDLLDGKSVKNSSTDKTVTERFERIKEEIESQGYQLKTVKDVYKQAGLTYYFVSVNGGKSIIVLDSSYHLDAKLEKTK